MTETEAELKKVRGIPVSPGIIIGKAHLVDRSKVQIRYQYLLNGRQLEEEVARFKEALRMTEDQLVHVKDRLPDQVKEYSYILDSHLMILRDSMLTDSTIKKVLDEHINAEWALRRSLADIRGIFNQIEDEYISSRVTDVENVTEMILRNLSGEQREKIFELRERVIIVAHDLTPADTAELNIGKVMGFITDAGGKTSHTGIMAQALEIPAVVGLESATSMVKDGDLLIVDGNTGDVILNPDDSAIIQYQEKQLQHEEFKSSVARTAHLPAVTLDGHRITVRANMEFLEEVAAVRDYGAEGVGLYRTEYLYLTSKGLPREEELVEEYREVVELIAPNPVVIRTVDLGSDKLAPGLDGAKEMNPAMGLRAIRFCLREPEIFRIQLRAILRTSAYGKVQLMFPMISGLQEILDAKAILCQAKAELDREKIDYDRSLKTGIMIEIPSAVMMSEVLAHHVDFFSIGTNDLIQYALAIDRVNEHVAFMYQPFHPAILRMIHHVVRAAKSAGIGVSLCGEMAGDPLCVTILLGLGIEELSMNPRSIPFIKKIIRSITMEEARVDFDDVIHLSTAKEVRAYIVDRMRSLVPELEEKGYLRM